MLCFVNLKQIEEFMKAHGLLKSQDELSNQYDQSQFSKSMMSNSKYFQTSLNIIVLYSALGAEGKTEEEKPEQRRVQGAAFRAGAGQSLLLQEREDERSDIHVHYSE